MKRSPMRKRSPLRRTAFKKRPRKSSVKVLADGREHLSGAAYKARCKEVYNLDEGRCQMPSKVYYDFLAAQDLMFCRKALAGPIPAWAKCMNFVSVQEAVFDHIQKRSLGRDDRAANLRTSELWCHNRRHELERLPR